jgi:hypothetical protein
LLRHELLFYLQQEMAAKLQAVSHDGVDALGQRVLWREQEDLVPLLSVEQGLGVAFYAKMLIIALIKG